MAHLTNVPSKSTKIHDEVAPPPPTVALVHKTLVDEASLAAFSIWSCNGPVVVWGNPHSGGENADAPRAKLESLEDVLKFVLF